MKTPNITPRIAILAPALTVAVLLTCAAVLSLPSAALAGKGNQGNPGVIPPQASPNDHTYGEWAALWWRWALSIPIAQHPITDTTGEFAATGQSGPVWFLAGTFGGAVTRTVTVPAGKGLFFPIINGAWTTTCTNEPRTIAGIRPLVAPGIDAATGLAAEIDGVPVENIWQYRAESPLFCTPLAMIGIYTAEDLEATCPPGASNPNCTADLPNPDEHFGPEDGFGPSMADGVWLMLAPLRRGQHTIHFTATGTGSFSLDVTYHLTVK